MTLQNIVNQTLYAARKATFGVALGFLLVSAPRVAYGQNNATQNTAIGISQGQTSTENPTSQQEEGNPLNDPTVDITEYGLNPPPINSINSSPEYPIINILAGMSRRELDESLAEQERRNKIAERQEAIDELTEQLERTEQSDFPSLTDLKLYYHDFEQRNGSTHYKAKSLDGYYVHYPQARRIYYVERGDVAGKGRTTIAHSIADENGTVLFRVNEQGEMVAVQSPAEETSSEKNVPQPLEEKTAEIDVKQPTAADIGIFQNIFDCQSKLELYSATGAGVGSLAVIGPLTALYIRRRRRKSRLK